MIFFFLTIQCNLKCLHCYIRTKNEEICFKPQNPLCVIDKLFDSNIEEIRLTGGEPLLCSQFINVIEKIASTGKSITIVTNGTMLTEEIMCALAEFRNTIRTIWISAYGADEEDYEHITRIKGSYHLFRVNMLKLINQQISIGINANVGFGDFVKWNNALSQFADEGVSRIKIIWTAPNGNAFNHWPRVSCDPARWIEIHSYIERLSKYYVNTEWRVAKCFLTKDDINKLDSNELKYMKCLLNNRSLLSIDIEGNLYPCCLLVNNKEYIIGNIKDHHVKQKISKWIQQPTITLLNNECLHYKNIKYKLSKDIDGLTPICPLYLDSLS